MDFTLGIEEEYQVIDPRTWDLSYDQDIIEEAGEEFGEMIKVEMHQSCVETGTKILKDIKEARKEVTFLRQTVYDLAKKRGLTIGAAGTHPFTKWEESLITDHPRYREIVEELQDAARSNLIFGMHVHVGIDDQEMAIHISNQIRYFLPHIFALSTNSPFWDGRNTGFRSYRTKVFDKFPRTGIPPYFNSSAEYFNYIDILVKTNSIDNAKKIWWDLRVHPFYPTIEILMTTLLIVWILYIYRQLSIRSGIRKALVLLVIALPFILEDEPEVFHFLTNTLWIAGLFLLISYFWRGNPWSYLLGVFGFIVMPDYLNYLSLIHDPTYRWQVITVVLIVLIFVTYLAIVAFLQRVRKFI